MGSWRSTSVVVTLAVATALGGCDGADPPEADGIGGSPTTAAAGGPTTASAGPATSAGTSTPSAPRGAGRVARTIQMLRSQQTALDQKAYRGYEATWAAEVRTARRRGRAIAANLRSMRVAQTSFHVVRSSLRATNAPGRSADPDLPAGQGSWTLEVDVGWRFDDVVGQDMVSRLAYTMLAVDGMAKVTEITASRGARQPIWLVSGLHTSRGRGGVLVIAPTAERAAGLARWMQVARRDVQGVLHDWPGHLITYSPATRSQFDSIVGAAKREYDDIAAVTVTVDGSAEGHGPVAIVVNPRIWPFLRPVGRHVVLTHEATHVATGGTTSNLPLWLTEGFADYVAVTAARVPVNVAAAAALRVVRRQGPPRRLPANREFAATKPDLESTYELSSLVMLTIVRNVGRCRLVDFYRDADAHPAHLEAVLERDLGTSAATLTSRWRRLLVGLAGAQ
ncbi:MAG: hypothetical protein H0V07_01640 [Propionibacteriales bacterium]|nr:hypothetical protein [Propionibacteriales bacterium]